MTSSNDSRQIIDQVALAVRDDSSAEAAALYRTWEAWGIWANGGFEAILTGGVADELAGVVAALREVGAGAMADLFDAAAAMLPEQVLGSYEARSEFACGPRGEVVLAAWRNLDRQMQALPDIHDYLRSYLAGHRDLLVLGDLRV